MTEPAITETVNIFNQYKETVGIIAATSFMGGFFVGFKLGVSSTQKQIEPMKEQIKLMRDMLEQSSKDTHQRSDEHRMAIEQIQKDLRIAIKGACPIVND